MKSLRLYEFIQQMHYEIEREIAMTEPIYVAYDIKGIQQFIYSIPRLRYVIGGSGLISQFDEYWKHATNLPGQLIFSGGGRGAFLCASSDAASKIQKLAIEKAHAVGLDIRIGSDSQIDLALQRSDSLYPYLPTPDKLQGRPCSESGLFPVPKSKKPNGKQNAVHPLIRKRALLSKQDPLGRLILNRIDRLLPSELKDHFTCDFFRNVSPEPIEDADEDVNETEVDANDDEAVARIGQRTLGSRNRWAVVVMDGNSIGRHFKTLRERMPHREAELIGRISQAIKETTEFAFDSALVNLINKWFENVKKNIDVLTYHTQGSTKPCLLVPVRPILVGGDDLILLCHCSYAMQFVQDMSLAFETKSQEIGELLQTELGYNPWEQNGGSLSISAGVLFTKTSLPLHTAIPYAEALLGNAKSVFRLAPGSATAIPSSIDWDIVTDSMVDHPTLRRQREHRFIDEDINTIIQLTRRPYTLGNIASPSDWPNFDHLRKNVMSTLREVPRSVSNELSQALRLPWAHRAQFLLSMRKNKRYRELVDGLDIDPSDSKGLSKRWFESRVSDKDREKLRYRVIETDILDALGILEEEHRLTQRTVPS